MKQAIPPVLHPCRGPAKGADPGPQAQPKPAAAAEIFPPVPHWQGQGGPWRAALPHRFQTPSTSLLAVGFAPVG